MPLHTPDTENVYAYVIGCGWWWPEELLFFSSTTPTTTTSNNSAANGAFALTLKALAFYRRNNRQSCVLQPAYLPLHLQCQFDCVSIATRDRQVDSSGDDVFSSKILAGEL